MAYSPLYRRMIEPNPDRAGLEAKLAEKLGEEWPAVLEYQAAESKRLGVSRGLWDIPGYLVELAARPWGELLNALVPDFQCQLPDVVVMLDLPVPVALERLSAREGTREVHETAALLGALRGAYLKLLDVLRAKGVQTEVLDATAGPDELLATLRERVGLPAE